VKAGYAGEDAPKFVFPSAVGAAGDAMEVDGAAGGRAKSLRVGNQALAHRLDGVEVASPFGADGAIEDWDAVEALWSHALTAQMRAKPAEHPLMLAEASDAARAAREKMVELAFEKYNVPGGSRALF
jgi:actin-like protein 6A